MRAPSTTPDAVICLECGKKFSMLKRHLGTYHDISAAAYRTKWKLPSTYPMVAPNYAILRSALAVKIGLGHSREKVTAGAKSVVVGKPKHGWKRAAAE